MVFSARSSNPGGGVMLTSISGTFSKSSIRDERLHLAPGGKLVADPVDEVLHLPAAASSGVTPSRKTT